MAVLQGGWDRGRHTPPQTGYKDILCNSRQREAHRFGLMYSESTSPWDSRTHVECVSKEQSIPAVNITGASPWVCESASPWVCESTSPQSIEYTMPTDSVERPTIHSVPLSSGHSGSTLRCGAAHHKFCACFSPPTVYCCAHLCPWAYFRDHSIKICITN